MMGARTPEEIRKVVLESLRLIVPEADVNALQPTGRLREQLDIDSMDFLNFLLAIDKALGVEIPEIDYPKLSTLDGSVAYLQRLLSAR